MTRRIFFDDSLPLLVQRVAAELGDTVLSQGVVLRDTSGRVAFFCRSDVDENRVHQLDRRLRETLGPYAGVDGAVVLPSSLGAEAMLVEPTARSFEVGNYLARLIDRRLVGADWSRTPAAPASPPRLVFASLKGGVGRSTAICVAAAHLAA